MIKQPLSDPSLSAPILPLAEEHIDHFLRHKLTTAMPVVAMFIGDKTIGQFKAVFMEELEGLFPIFIDAYLDSILEQGRLTKMLWNKLAVKSVLAGAGLGLGIGLLQWMVLSLGHFSL
jgi:hypothetical protein